MSKKHKEYYGKDVQNLWAKIAEMLDKKNRKLSKAEMVAKSTPENPKTKEAYERIWRIFLHFTSQGKLVFREKLSLDKSGSEEPTEEEYLKFFTYLCVVKQVKASTLYGKFAMLNNGHQASMHNRGKFL